MLERLRRLLRFRSNLAAVAPVAILAASCTERGVVDPAETVDQWVLVSVAGDPLPARTRAGDTTSLIRSERLVFLEDGSGALVSSYRTLASSGTPMDRTGRSTFRWRRNNDLVEIFLTCPPNAACIVGPHIRGSVDGNSVNVVWVGTVLRAPWQYARR